jgi:dTDP-N-acetylfucosamine:lipid II N-acetylfucosaminyltransferase
MNILHLVHDEKFIQFVVGELESHPQATNKFIVFVDNPSEPLKHISDLPFGRIVDRSYVLSSEMKEDLLWCDCLVIHYLERLKAQIVLLAPSSVTIVWSGWGADYYHLLKKVMPPLLGLKTARLVRELSHEDSFLRRVRKVLSQLRNVLVYDRMFRKAIKRVDLFSAPIPEDYDLLKSALGANFRAEYIQLNYGNNEQAHMIGPANITGQNILVGNSATKENNHVEAFELLSRYDLGDREVIVPLSYGDPNYRDAIISYGERLFGDRFRPLVEFTALDTYQTIIASCSIVVMNHKRQQALGNVNAMLIKGAKVFFDKDSIVFKFFKKRGAHVFSLELFKEQSEDIFEPLSEIQQHQNRLVLEGFWSEEVVSNNYSKLLNVLQEKSQHRAKPFPSGSQPACSEN